MQIRTQLGGEDRKIGTAMGERAEFLARKLHPYTEERDGGDRNIYELDVRFPGLQ